jgi:hypothetical protein
MLRKRRASAAARNRLFVGKFFTARLTSAVAFAPSLFTSWISRADDMAC